jgi:16S rRNA (guanine527-N7)-methyltransferase
VKQPPTEALARYRALVESYHGTLDLVSDRGLAEWERHVSDAAAYARVLAALSPAPRCVLDVGSGVGLPGLVIAMALPDVRVVLVERRRRRAAFLTLARGRLGLLGVRVVTGDVRGVADVRVDAVTAQAVASFGDVYRLTAHLHVAEVVLLSRKGDGWRDEVAALGAELGAAPVVVAEEPLEARGTLVALRLPGGRACRSSG